MSCLERLDILDIEEALSSSIPFGSADYILDRVSRHYMARLTRLSHYLPAAGMLARQMDLTTIKERIAVIVDPVFRITIDAAVLDILAHEVALSNEDLNSVLNFAIERLGKYSNSACRSRHTCPCDWPHARRGCNWIWSEDLGKDDENGRLFYKYFHSFQGKYLRLKTVSQDQLQSITMGDFLLRDLLPKLSNSVMDHVQLIALVDLKFIDVYFLHGFTHTRSNFFVSIRIDEFMEAAEHLLHEALHAKFIDLIHTHSLLAMDYHDAGSPKIQPIWHPVRQGKGLSGRLREH